VVERADRAPVGTFYAPGAWGPVVELDEGAAHHASVKRLAVGDPVRLTSGDGRRVLGEVTALAKRRLVVSTIGEDVEEIPAAPHVELWAPVGDRERMLWLAEKATELGLTAWRPVIYRRSRSVSPRGEGDAFREKVRARMISALEQSGGAWLPELLPEATLERALPEVPWETGLLLDAGGNPIREMLSRFASHDSRLTGTSRPTGTSLLMNTSRLTLSLGPEGGLEPDERDEFLAVGWRRASLGPNVLRFETAAVAALAIVRSLHW
jgi:16S rRNA (uracil1498-N3)-methyltransferase